ncbi:MAG: GTP pyrophosphokinase family protein, partial [Romboutsia timonensis]
MEYEKWDEVLAPYNNEVEELKVNFKNIRKEFLKKGEYSPIEFVTGRT